MVPASTEWRKMWRSPGADVEANRRETVRTSIRVYQIRAYQLLMLPGCAYPTQHGNPTHTAWVVRTS